jgi:peptide/nickel transport system ATP-binding protein
MPLLEVKNLKTYFRTGGEPRRVVDGISFNIEAGEVLGLVGESGCGKSLTALSLMRLIPRPGYIAGGSIVLQGRDLVALPGPDVRAARGREIGMIFQEPMTSLNPVLSIGTQILEAVRRAEGIAAPATRSARRAEELARAVEALRLVELPDPEQQLAKYPHQLSGGMRQRVMIAMALACRPKLLLADEPTTALDVTVEAKILDLLRDLQHKLGMAIVFITHDLAVVAEMAHRVAVMYAGKIVEIAPAAELFARPKHPYTERLLECRPSRGRRGQALETIKGIVPDPKNYVPGCRFCDRCPRVFGPCRDQEPPLKEIGTGHAVACHLYSGGVAEGSGSAKLEVRNSKETEKNETEKIAAQAAVSREANARDAVLLQARGVTKYFPIRRGIFQRVVGHVKAVDGVDFAIPHGKTLALVGESGCGKTTLGKTIIRLLPPTGGEILFAGHNLAALDDDSIRSFRRAVQIVFQDPYSSLNPRMMVEHIIEEGMRVHGIGATAAERRERVSELLSTVGLHQNAMTNYPHEFSGGQRQRIGIARALAVEPKFIVLDEPTSALDVSIQAQILNLLRKLQEQGKERLTYLFITHDLGVVEYMADEVAAMYLGRIVEHAPTEALFDEPLHPYTRALLSAIPRVSDAADGKAKAERIRLGGDVPSPSNPPRGCHFHPRCPHAMSRCREVYPEVTKVGDDRMVRCHLHGKA